MFENEKSYDEATQTHSYSFGPTMKMSPYLLAFVISDYQIDSAQGPVHPKSRYPSLRPFAIWTVSLIRSDLKSAKNFVSYSLFEITFLTRLRTIVVLT